MSKSYNNIKHVLEKKREKILVYYSTLNSFFFYSVNLNKK